MTFSDAMAYLFGLVDYEKTPAQTAMTAYLNLDRMRDALARAGNPQAGLRCVHLAGTKGKGSTAVMIAAILRAAGRRVGLYTKPHLVDFRERIRIDDALIGEADFAAIMTELRPLIEAMRPLPNGAPTFFEVCVLIAFLWFARQQTDIVVLETGMGGRLDATNVVQPLATAITTIALDHTVELGDTVALIAAEKAGIIKSGAPVVSAPQTPDAAAVLAQVADARGCSLYRVGAEIRVEPGAQVTPGGQRFSITGRLDRYTDLDCPLLGAHQLVNAAVAVGLAECLREVSEPITADAIRAGLAGVCWPGRLQVLRAEPLLLLDGAHDPAAVDALTAALDRHFPGRPRVFVLGFAREKDWQRMLAQLAPHAARFVLTAAATPRAVPPDELLAAARALGVPCTTAPNVATALRHALAAVAPTELLCLTGSLYAVGDALKWWQQQG